MFGESRGRVESGLRFLCVFKQAVYHNVPVGSQEHFIHIGSSFLFGSVVRGLAARTAEECLLLKVTVESVVMKTLL